MRSARTPGRDRRLRATILSLRTCLNALPRAERRVLLLRAGLGRPTPRPRERVARMMHASVRRIERLERAGLGRLRAARRRGACRSGVEGGSRAASVTPIVGSRPAGTAGGDAAGGTAASAGQAQHAVAGSRHRALGARAQEASRSPDTAHGFGIGRSLTGRGTGFDVAVVLAPLALLGFGLVIGRELRRAWHA